MENSTAENEAEARIPKFVYHIRPADYFDMPGVVEIYNLEVLEGTQALDTEPLRDDDFYKLLRMSQENKLPFIVALLGSSASSQTGQPYVLGESWTAWVDTVIAFAFLTINQPGLSGRLDGTSRYSAKLHLFVHPQYRRKGVGQAMLDQLMHLASTRYKQVGGAEYVNPRGDPLYTSAAEAPRKYHRAFVEVRLKSRADPAAGWYETMLRKFSFRRVGSMLDNAHLSRVGQGSFWLHTAIFQHNCCDEEDVDKTQ